MNSILKVITILILVALALFCAFGFLASFEYPSPNLWHLGYATAFALLTILIWHVGRSLIHSCLSEPVSLPTKSGRL